MPQTLIVPSDWFSPDAPDEHFLPEAEAALAAGIKIATLNQEALDRGEVKLSDDVAGRAFYRGWMLADSDYQSLHSAVVDKGGELITSPKHYRQAHWLPGWIDLFRDLTPFTVVSKDGDYRAALRQMDGACIIKDYVKSAKHKWTECTFIPDPEDEAHALRVIDNFLTERDTNRVGEVCFRQFEDFQSPEMRSWWVDGQCLMIGAHPDRPKQTRDISSLEEIADAVQQLDNRFVSVDLAYRRDGLLRVVEVGDGQVSDRPATCQTSDFIKMLSQA
jgi:hypothetical protein